MADAISNAPGSPGEVDPFLHLHKMSTTAGLGSGDYVAINGTAIAAILLGVGSAIVLFNSKLLLVVPLAGVICAVMAFLQISRSNGTQTGILVAVIGLLLSLGFGGYYSGNAIYASAHNRSDEEEIVALIHRLGDRIKAKDYAGAYGTLDDHLTTRVSAQNFEAVGSRVAASPLLGNLTSIDWNELLIFDTDPVTGERVANGMIKFWYSNAGREPVRVAMSFRKVDGKWLIDQIPTLFPEQVEPAPPKKLPMYGPPKPTAAS